MSQVLFHCPRINHQVVLLFKDSKARPLSPADATPSAAFLPLHLVGLRRGLARKMFAPFFRSSRQLGGFSLLDPLVGILVFAGVMVGAINLWRLAEYKCARARIDARVAQILRENIDYVTYVAYDLLPADGTQPRSGFLLHPLDPATGRYKDIYPFTVTAAVTTTGAGTPAETKQIILTLSYNTAPDPQAADSPQQTIRTNVLQRAKD